MDRRSAMSAAALCLGAIIMQDNGNGGTSHALADDRRTVFHRATSQTVNDGDVPGLVAGIWHKGEVLTEALGHRTIGGEPMRADAIFRIASLTKPVTATAAMILVEEGRIGLDDPVDSFLPELSSRRVLKRIDGPLNETVPASRSITLRDLLTMRFGLGAIMVWPPKYPIQLAMAEAHLAPGYELFSGTADDYLRRLGALPLAAQPGQSFFYDTGFYVAGILIERIAGKSLGTFLSERVFDPLGMVDTGFFTPPDKTSRLSGFYRKDQQTGKLISFGGKWAEFTSSPALEAGNGGLVSTVTDYLAFQRMLLGGGSLAGKRILSTDSVAAMTANQLSPEQLASPHAAPILGPSTGWGFGLAVEENDGNMFGLPARSFGWNGGYGSTAYADPNSDLAGVLLTTRAMDSPEPPEVFKSFWKAAYEWAGIH
jgi:CubicO group peptidase (beta-lactamase class C family)